MGIDRTKIKLILAFAAVYLIWGSTYLAIKIVIESIPPFLMASVRHLTAGVIIFIITRFTEKDKIKWEHVKSNAIIGALLLLGGNGGVVWAERIVPSGLTALLVSMVPIWILLINWLFLKKGKPSKLKFFGIFLGVLGILFLISPTELLKVEAINPLGAIVLLITSMMWASGSIFTQYAPMPKSKFTAIALQMLTGGGLLFIWSTIVGEYKDFHLSQVTTESFLALIYLAVFGSIIGYSSYIWLLHTAGPALTSTYAYVNPVVAVILGWIVINEPMNIRVILSSLVIISAVIMITTDHRKERKKLRY